MSCQLSMFYSIALTLPEANLSMEVGNIGNSNPGHLVASVCYIVAQGHSLANPCHIPQLSLGVNFTNSGGR
jgi:hypothetical protein